MDLGNPAAFLEQLLDTFTVVDAQGVVCSQSPWFERILGYEQGRLAGESVFTYIHPDDRPRVIEAFTKVTRNPGATIAAELRFRHRNGSWQVLQAAGKSFVDSTGTIRVVVSARNVTERKLTEEALRESEENYRTLVENLNDIIFVHDASGIVTYVSPVVETLGGYKPEEIIGRSFTEFVHPDDLPVLLVSFQRTLAGHLEPSEFRAIAKSGEIRWVRSSSRPIVKDGRVVGLRGVLTDISERKRAEQQTAALLEIAKDISGTLDLHELLCRVEQRAADALACTAVMTFFWDTQHDRFNMVSQYDRGDFAGAVAAFRVSSQQNPAAYYNLGNVLEHQGDRRGALDAYKQYLAAAPPAPDTAALMNAVRQEIFPTPAAGTAQDHFRRGQSLLDKQDATGALAEFLSALRLKPNYAEASNHLGLAFRAAGDLDEAIAAYQTAIRLDATFNVAYRNLAQAFEDKGDRTAAAQGYDRYLLLAPGAADAAEIRAKIAKLRGGQ